jgi:hypothetical protein
MKKKTTKKNLYKYVLAISLLGVVIAFLYLPKKPNSETITLKGQTLDLPINVSQERNKWEQAIDQFGPNQAWDQFKNEYKNEHFGTQHSAAHIFGEALFDTVGVEGVATCDNSFAFGCYHSFFAQAISYLGPDSLVDLDQACIDRYGPLGLGCQHGIGHGLVEYYGQNNLIAALDACHSLSWKGELFGCSGGVFMEHNFPTVVGGNTATSQLREADPNNLYQPCIDLPDKYKPACYYELGQWWDKIFDHNFQEIGKLCQTIDDPHLTQVCYQGIGNVAGPSSDYNVSLTIANCKKMPTKEGEVLCRAGASWSFTASQDYKNMAPQVCEGMNQDDQSQCATESNLVKESDYEPAN